MEETKIVFDKEREKLFAKNNISIDDDTIVCYNDCKEQIARYNQWYNTIYVAPGYTQNDLIEFENYLAKNTLKNKKGPTYTFIFSPTEEDVARRAELQDKDREIIEKYMRKEEKKKEKKKGKFCECKN